MAQFGKFNLPDELYYHPEDHVWARIEGDLVRVGVDDVAQISAQAVSHVRLKPAGRPIAPYKPFGTMEAGKYVGPLRLPLGGTVVEVNEELMESAGVINRDPYGKGWMVLVQPEDLERDLPKLVHGEQVQAWLEKSVADWTAKGLLKP